MRRDRWAAPVLAVALTITAGACSGNQRSSDSESSGAGEAQTANSSDRLAAAAEGDAVTASARLPEGAAQAAEVETEVVYTGSLTVRVDDRRQATDDAVAVAEANGGRLFDQRIDLEGEGDAVLTLKVAPDRFEAAMAALAELGRPVSNEVSSDDVTAEVVDLEGRLDTAERSATRLRELLVAATDVNAIVAVEKELAKREAEIEAIQGQLRVLEAQIDLATITVTFTERDGATVNRDIPGFGTGLSSGLVAVANLGAAGLTAAGFALPFLALLAPVVVAWRFWRRRRRGARSGRPPTPPTSPTPPPGMTWDGTAWRPSAPPGAAEA